jgi:hypothetical protein
MHPYKVNIDNSPRLGLKTNDFIKFISTNRYLPNIYKNQIGVVIERYKTLNQFNKQYWNYFTRIKLLTGEFEGRERSFVSGGSFMKKFIPQTITLRPKRPHIRNFKHPEKSIKYKKISDTGGIGTCLQGYLYLSYNEICSIFGTPNYGPSGDGKVDWEWVFSLNKEVVTIYNYKTGPSYSRENKDVKPQDLEYWHVGGRNKGVLNLLTDYIIYKHGPFDGGPFIYED